MKIEIVTDLAEEPVKLEDVKLYLKVTGNGHDLVLQNMITAARKYLERATNLSFGQKEIKVTATYEIDEGLLPYGPVENVVASGEYIYEYDAGFDTLPEDLRQLLLMMIKHWFDVDDVSAELPGVIKNIINANSRSLML